MIKRKKLSGREIRRIRIRKKVNGTAERPRLSIYRSLKHTYAQLIDDERGISLGSVSTKSEAILKQAAEAKGKVEPAKLVGMAVAELAKSKNITAVVFDRGGYLYHGRVKAVAEGAREGGLQV